MLTFRPDFDLLVLVVFVLQLEDFTTPWTQV